MGKKAVEENVLESILKPSLKLQGKQTVVVYTEDGMLLHYAGNYHQNAIIVLSNKQLEKHDRDKEENRNLQWNTLFSDLSYSFGEYGTNYLVDEMLKLWKEATKEKLPFTDINTIVMIFIQQITIKESENKKY